MKTAAAARAEERRRIHDQRYSLYGALEALIPRMLTTPQYQDKAAQLGV